MGWNEWKELNKFSKMLRYAHQGAHTKVAYRRLATDCHLEPPATRNQVGSVACARQAMMDERERASRPFSRLS